MFRSHVLVCGGTGCHSNRSAEIIKQFNRQIQACGLEKDVQVVQTGCFGLCAAGPVVIIYPEGAFYSHVKIEDVEELVSEHLVKGRIVERLLHKDEEDEPNKLKALSETNFYKKQTSTNTSLTMVTKHSSRL